MDTRVCANQLRLTLQGDWMLPTKPAKGWMVRVSQGNPCYQVNDADDNE